MANKGPSSNPSTLRRVLRPIVIGAAVLTSGIALVYCGEIHDAIMEHIPPKDPGD